MEIMLGIYEKALPKNTTWLEKLTIAKSLGFNFVEMSIDESDERLSRLEWDEDERKKVKEAIDKTGIKIFSICLSGHRRFPFGSLDLNTRRKSLDIMEKCLDLALDLGVRNIQLAGYDVYYEEKSDLTREYFIQNLKKAVNMAASKQVMLSIEIMDDPFMNSITKFKKIKAQIPSPWLQVYPDLGNLSAWPENDPGFELETGIDFITAIHIKDTINVTDNFPGTFKKVPWGEGDVNFLGLFKTLKRIGYSGVFLIEMWSEDSEDTINEIKEAKEFILPILKEAGY